MRRRTFIIGAAATWPITALAQRQGQRPRRIGVMMNIAPSDPQGPVRLAALLTGLKEHGWTVGENLRIEYRWAGGDPALYQMHAAELVALAPEAILATSGQVIVALQRAGAQVPVVFVNVIDPVGSGRVNSLAHPGGLVTGFSGTDYGISGKWLELLKQIAPRVSRVAVLRDPASQSGPGQFGALQGAGGMLGVELTPVDVRTAEAIERAVVAFARGANGGMIVTSGTFPTVHRNLIIDLAARHQLPTTYPEGFFVHEGGLISYGPDRVDPYRRAADYIDRILKGEKPGDLPVQAPMKYELTLNLKTAKALGLAVPDMLLTIANEVIE
jgi:putative ABC transport system substrate-binding protein